MRDLDVEKTRQKLLDERERVHEELETVEKELSNDDSGEGQSELADYDNHPADAGSETFVRERDLAVRDNYRDIIGHIDEALGKLERGTYGECDRCGRRISKERLEAVPYATFCVECQDIIEGE